jgi:hypothetical protein
MALPKRGFLRIVPKYFKMRRNGRSLCAAPNANLFAAGGGLFPRAVGRRGDLVPDPYPITVGAARGTRGSSSGFFVKRLLNP